MTDREIRRTRPVFVVIHGGRRRTHDRPRVPSNVHSIADEELRWFFKMAEGEAGSTLDRRTVALGFGRGSARAYRKIRGWLLAMTDRDAGVLKAAYMVGPWPPGVRDELGRLSGVVVRLASAEVGWPDDSTEQQLLEAQVANQLEAARLRDGPAAFIRFRRRAKELLKTALRSYERERGDGPSAVEGLR